MRKPTLTAVAFILSIGAVSFAVTYLRIKYTASTAFNGVRSALYNNIVMPVR